jgi:site-specific recombinase XerD
MSMLEYFFKSPLRLRQLRRKPLSQHIETLAKKLHRLGFTRASGLRILGMVGSFNDFALSVGVENADKLDEGLVKRFFCEELPSSGTFNDAPVVMRHLLEHLREQGVLPDVATTESIDPFEPLVTRYNEHLRDVCGLIESSRSQYLRNAQRLLGWFAGRHRERPLAKLTGVDVLEFVTELAPLHPSGSWRQNLCSLTRVFLRYLKWEGIVQIDLDRVVPKLPNWRMSTLARHLPWKRVLELIDSVDTSKRGGLRDKAVLLLIASLGLRRQEVSDLQLHHIDWREAEIRVAQTKSRRERVLPLPKEVGVALADYILHGRPRIPVPQVFLSNRAPLGPIVPHSVGCIVGRRLRRAGIEAPNYGAHLLRHSLATHLVNQGVPIKQIADLLGHSSINTTAIYTKVDTATLATVALPFPGGEA